MTDTPRDDLVERLRGWSNAERNPKYYSKVGDDYDDVADGQDLMNEAADALSRQQPSEEAVEVATKYMDNGPYGAWAVMASEILRLAGAGKT